VLQSPCYIFWVFETSGFRCICIVCNKVIRWFFVIGFIAFVWIHHEQLFYKLVLQNRYFVPVPVFEQCKQVTGSRDYGILSPSWNVLRMCPHEVLRIMPATALTLNTLTCKIWWAPNNASGWQMGFNSAFKGLSWFLMPQFWTSGGSMCNSAERPFVAPGPLGRRCKAALCYTRATWKAVQRGPLLHQGHLEGGARRIFVAPGSLGRLCRAAFCCTRATWKAVQSGPLLH